METVEARLSLGPKTVAVHSPECPSPCVSITGAMVSPPGVYDTCLLPGPRRGLWPSGQLCSCSFSSCPFFTGWSEDDVTHNPDSSSPAAHGGLWGLASSPSPVTLQPSSLFPLLPAATFILLSVSAPVPLSGTRPRARATAGFCLSARWCCACWAVQCSSWHL